MDAAQVINRVIERPWNWRLRLGRSKSGRPVIRSQYYFNRMSFVPSVEGEFYVYVYPDGLEGGCIGKYDADLVWSFVQQVRADLTTDILDIWQMINVNQGVSNE